MESGHVFIPTVSATLITSIKTVDLLASILYSYTLHMQKNYIQLPKKNAILVFATIGLEGVQHGNSDRPSSESKVRDLEILCMESGTANHGEAGARMVC